MALQQQVACSSHAQLVKIMLQAWLGLGSQVWQL